MYRSQWLLVSSLLGFMISLLIIAKVNTSRAASLLPEYELRSDPVPVTIEGAVAKPGTYTVPAGTPLSNVLKKARPRPWADLQKISPRLIVEEPLSLKVEALEKVVVTVRGAVVEEVEVALPAQSRISDLKAKVILTEEADRSFFRRRKWLKNGEIIEVPKKTVE